VDHAVDRRLQGMLGATGVLPVAVKEIAPEALMRVQVAAMELPVPAATTPASSDAQHDGDSERARRPPGRPSMREPLRAQLFVRAQQGVVAKGIGEEARQLRAWAIGNRQDGDPPVPLAGTIENGIRRHYARALEISNGVKSLMAKNK
ncbi:MAG: hypothetical protein KIS63_19025, partial [Caldilineales bacterium]|nr:hypothetical protein [Caldilineales bacterium]